MRGTVVVDVINGLLQAIHDADIEDVIVVFGEPVLLGCRLQVAGCRLENFARRAVGAELHLFLREAAVDDGEKFFGHGLINEEGFHRVANGRPLTLGVDHDFLGHLQVGLGLDIDMADTFVVFEDRNFRALGDGANEALATARHAEVDVLPQREQFPDGFAVGRRHNLDRVPREISDLLLRRFDHDFGDDAVGIQRLLATAQDRRVAGFQTKPRGIGGHIRARLVNDDDDANGRGNLLQPQAVRTESFIKNPANWIREGGDFAQRFGHGGDPRVIEPKAVEHRGGQTQLRRGFRVARVGLLDVVAVLLQRVSHGDEALILFRRGEPGQFARGGFGLLGQLRHLFRQGHGLKLSENRRVERRKL